VNTFVLPDGARISDTNVNANTDIDTNTVIGTDTKTDAGSNTDTDTSTDTDTNVNITKYKTKPTDSKKINYGNNGTMVIASDISNSKVSSLDDAVTEVNSFKDENIQFTTDKVELGSGSDKITYYVSDIYVTNVNYIKTAFATGEYGKNLRNSTASMADANNALLAISGDFYGNGETGIVIRNGILYRSVIDDADVCVLFTDGTMKTYSPEEFDAEEVVEQGSWQAWTFGPELLDGNGNILASFNTTTYLNSTNPRCAIGYAEPGHYVFVVVDGRDEGYSMGVTLSELAQIMVKAGCVTAYNLDGGKSAAMVFDGSYVNQPSQGGRTISDIIYIGE
jgi:exopolysaccharide biosynthesis protein